MKLSRNDPQWQAAQEAQRPQEGTPPRVSDEKLERGIIEQGDYFASFRAGIDCIGGAQAKAGFDALLDLRYARQRIAALESENAALREACAELDRGFALAERLLAAMWALMPAKPPHADDVAGATRDKWQRLADAVIESDDHTTAHASNIKRALANGAEAGATRDARLIQQGRDEERAEHNYGRGVAEVGASPTPRPASVPSPPATNDSDRAGRLQDRISSGRLHMTATCCCTDCTMQRKAIAAEFAAVRQQGREEGARVALESFADKLRDDSDSMAAGNLILYTDDVIDQIHKRIAALPLTPEQPTIGNTAVFDPRAVVGDCEPKQPDTEGTKP